jgi:hypothetical protein
MAFISAIGTPWRRRLWTAGILIPSSWVSSEAYGRGLEEIDCCWMAGVRFVAALTRGAWDGFVMLFHGTGICQL